MKQTQAFTAWLSVQGITLSEESKEKVSVITDINKMMLMVGGEQLSTTEFDYLYDMPIEQLRQYEIEAQLNATATMRWRQYQERVNRNKLGGTTIGGDLDAD